MLLNLNKLVLSVDGKPMLAPSSADGKEFEEVYLNKVLGLVLYNVAGVEDSLKYKTLGEDLYRNGEVNVDESDLGKIEDVVKKQEHWPAYIKGPIELEIRQVRRKSVADEA